MSSLLSAMVLCAAPSAIASFLLPSRPSVCVEPRAVLSLRGRSFTGPVVSLALACYLRLPSLVFLCSSSPAVGEGNAGYAFVFQRFVCPVLCLPFSCARSFPLPALCELLPLA